MFITLRQSALRVVAGLAISSAGCSAANTSVSGSMPPLVPTQTRLQNSALQAQGSTPIDHVIVIVQENRSVDDLFNGLPGADTVRSGKNLKGQTVRLQPISLSAPFDLSHRHSGWIKEYHGGAMDGFSSENENCHARSRSKCPREDVAAYSFVPKDQVKPYWDIARAYVFGDRMFQTNQGPSFPAHQYLISGTSTISDDSTIRAAENVSDPKGIGKQGGCDSIPSTRVATIAVSGADGPDVFPCFKRRSIMDLMNDSGISWHYYQALGGAGQWHAVDAIQPIWSGPTYANVIWPSSRVLKDVAAGKLAGVTFVTPTAAASDHSGRTNGSGPDWVASIVNAVGRSQFWQSTAIFVVWDDWGGWYDHVKPEVYNTYEDSFRVPLLVVSPYAKHGYVSHTTYEFGSILKFIETTFSLPSLRTTDERSNSLSDCFDFSAKPRKFKKIKTGRSPQYFLNQIDARSPDDDY